MIIKPKCRGFICVTAHPAGCYKNVGDMVKAAQKAMPGNGKKPANVVVIGASSGYGLASRVAAAFTYQAKTIGVSFEKSSSENRTATAGYYNNLAFDRLAQQNGLPCKTINGDAFSYGTKDEVVTACRELFGGEKVDLFIYSLAAPKRINPETGIVHSSVIKPIGKAYVNKSVDFHTGVVEGVTINPADGREIDDTVAVMGGEDWDMWITRMIKEDLVSKDFVTVAYSYVGPPITHEIYKNGTIGRAKDDVLKHCGLIGEKLKPHGGNAYVSVNKALVTQASSAIPVVPLYISLLYKIMKRKGTHETCYEQMARMFADKIYSGREDFADSLHRIRMDDYEMSGDVQEEAAGTWDSISSDNIEELTDIAGYRKEFYSLFGFSREDVDYEEDVADY